MSPASPQRATVTADERAQFERDGFVALARPVISPAEVQEVLELLVPLLARADELPEGTVRDLGIGDTTGGRIVEVYGTTELVPQLRRTAAFRRCRTIATDLTGCPMAPSFDHVIAKPPHNLSSTAWHQDAAYTDTFERPPTTHMWLALQEATVDNGCMWFIPGSHRAPVAHRPRGGDERAPGLEALSVDEAAAVACPLPAGGVTIHHPGTLHSTGPNRTDHPRIAWILHHREEGSWGMRALVPRPLRELRRRLLSR